MAGRLVTIRTCGRGARSCQRSVEISVESVDYRSAFVRAVLSQVLGAVAGPRCVRLPARRSTER